MPELRLTKTAWKISLIITIALLVSLIGIWYQASNVYNLDKDHLTTPQMVNDYLNKVWLNNQKNQKPVFIKTGVYIQSVSFNSANNVTLTGYIWLTYPKTLAKNQNNLFILPEAINPRGVYERVDYQTSDKDTVTKAIYFDAVTRQDFDYKKYPFDSKVIWLHIQPKDFYQNIILIPDLTSYDSTLDDLAFGINKNIVLDGFTIKETFFSYHLTDYDTNLGIKNFVSKDKFPELMFNIVITRNLINAAILHLLPLITILCLAFAVLMIATLRENRIKCFNFSVSSTLGTCSALFFSTMLMHGQLRNYLSTGYSVYLENLYVIVYLIIISVALNAYLFSNPNKERFKFIHYADNLIPKVLYWPLTLTLILIETIHSLILN